MTDFTSDEDTAQARSMMKELLDLESGLAEYEIDFLDNVYRDWRGNITVNQYAYVLRLYKKLM